MHTDSNRYSLNEFEWSVRRVKVENIAVTSYNTLHFIRKRFLTSICFQKQVYFMPLLTFIKST